jgi:hypothetical protein
MAHIEKAHDETAWFLDSGCSNHMSGHKNFFLELDENFHRSVKLGVLMCWERGGFISKSITTPK